MPLRMQPAVNRRGLLVCFGLLALWALKFSPHLQAPQIWAEDGSLFLHQFLQHGIASLWLPYQGFIYVLQRSLAFPMFFVHPEHLPLYTVFVATVMTALASFLMWLFAPVAHSLQRLAVALTPLLMPHGGEVFGSIVNLQWIYAPLLLLIPWGSTYWSWRFLVLSVLSVTGPFGLISLPVYLLALAIYRDRLRLVLLLIATAGGAVQIYFWFNQSRSKLPILIEHATYYLQEIGAGLFLGWLKQPTPPLHGVVLLVGSLGLLSYLAWATWRHRSPWLFSLFGMLILMMVAAIVGKVHFPMSFYIGGARYYFVPTVLICWLLLWIAFTPRAWIARSLLLVIVASGAVRFFKPPFPPQKPSWREQVATAYAGQSQRLVIFPRHLAVLVDYRHSYWRQWLTSEQRREWDRLLTIPAVDVRASASLGTESELTVITLNAATDQPVVGDQTVVLFGTGDAVYQKDYTLSTVVLKIPDGKRHASATMRIVRDAVPEKREVAVIELRQPSAGLRIGALDRVLIRIDD